MIIDWTNTEVTGISGIRIEMPNKAKILLSWSSVSLNPFNSI